MKIIQFFLGLIILTSCANEPILISCIDPALIVDPQLGTSTAKANFFKWNARTLSDFSSNDSNLIDIRIGTINLKNCDYYGINFKYISLEKQNVNLALSSNSGKFDASFTINHGGDAIAEEYILADTVNNFINISNINENNVVGTYSLTLIVSPTSVGKGQYDPSLPDTLIFTNGVFKVPLPK